MTPEELDQLEERLIKNGLSSEGYEDEVDDLVNEGKSAEDIYQVIQGKAAKAEALAEGI